MVPTAQRWLTKGGHDAWPKLAVNANAARSRRIRWRVLNEAETLSSQRTVWANIHSVEAPWARYETTILRLVSAQVSAANPRSVETTGRSWLSSR